MLVPDWKMYIDIRSKKTIENKDYIVDDFDFYNMVDNKGASLYRINNLEFIRKIN